LERNLNIPRNILAIVSNHFNTLLTRHKYRVESIGKLIWINEIHKLNFPSVYSLVQEGKVNLTD